MIKLGCNWSPELGQLLEMGQAPIDFIKTGTFGLSEAELVQMRSKRPVLLHGLGQQESAGMRNPENVDIDRANRLIAYCGSPHYGIYFSILNADVDADMTANDIHSRMAEGIRFFQQGIAVPLLLENTPDSPKDRTVFDHSPCAEPELISRLLVETDTYLLLDLTHAKITCQYRQWDIQAFLKALPLDRVREIHVNGSRIDADGWPEDTHQPMEDFDVKLLEWVLQSACPDIITLEYGTAGNPRTTDRDILRQQLSRLRTIRDA
jgi:uncharacterized protein